MDAGEKAFSQAPLSKTSSTVLDRVQGRILAFIGVQGAVPESRITQRVIGRRQTKLKALRLLVSTGAITRTGSGRRADPFYYVLVTPPSTPQPPKKVTVEEIFI